MREDLIDKIADRESRIQDAVEFFGWPRELVETMFKHSKEYFEGPWQRFFPGHVHEYYAAGYYLIRQLSYSKREIFTDNIRTFLDRVDGSVLDYACGVGDYAMYLAMQGFKVYAVEHPGIPAKFLSYRFKKYDLPITVCSAFCVPLPVCVLPDTDYTLLVSAIDHIVAPVPFVKWMCDRTRKEIFATPCIDETYDRPTHIKEILKDVPAAFELIREHNRKILPAEGGDRWITSKKVRT